MNTYWRSPLRIVNDKQPEIEHGFNGMLSIISPLRSEQTFWISKKITVSGEQAYDFEEVAQFISEASGIKINYVSPSEAELKKH